MRDQPEQTQANQNGAAQPIERRGAHRCRARSGGPATNRASVAAIDSVTGTSIVKINNLAWDFGYARKAPGDRETGEPDREESRRPGDQHKAQPTPTHLRCVDEASHHYENPHGGEDRCTLEFTPGSSRADPKDMDADEYPNRRQQLCEKSQRTV